MQSVQAISYLVERDIVVNQKNVSLWVTSSGECKPATIAAGVMVPEVSDKPWQTS